MFFQQFDTRGIEIAPRNPPLLDLVQQTCEPSRTRHQGFRGASPQPRTQARPGSQDQIRDLRLVELSERLENRGLHFDRLAQIE